jgi:hypothetical protein
MRKTPTYLRNQVDILATYPIVSAVWGFEVEVEAEVDRGRMRKADLRADSRTEPLA